MERKGNDSGAAGQDDAGAAHGKAGVPAEECVSLREYNELKERMMRIAADFDNYKKRTRNEAEVSRNTGKAEAVAGLLPVLDEFEIAMAAIQKSKDKETFKGVEMLYANMLDALKRAGLVEIEATGMFDPSKHEIVMAVESDKRHGTILEVVRRGYAVGGIMLRPSSVIVAREPSGQAGDVAAGNAGEEHNAQGG